jgi:hypothetical protein
MLAVVSPAAPSSERRGWYIVQLAVSFIGQLSRGSGCIAGGPTALAAPGGSITGRGCCCLFRRNGSDPIRSDHDDPYVLRLDGLPQLLATAPRQTAEDGSAGGPRPTAAARSDMTAFMGDP